MRGTEALLGSLLVASGLMGPLVGPSETVPLRGELEADATFEEWSFTGAARVEAAQAAFRTTGPAEAKITGAAHVEVFHYSSTHETSATLDFSEDSTELLSFEWEHGFVTPAHDVTYENVTLSILGERDGRLLAWPNASLGPANLELELENTTTPVDVAPSNGTRPWAGPRGHPQKLVEAPLIALAHGGYQEPFLTFSEVGFDGLHGDGGLQVIVHGGSTITAEEGNRTDTYQTWTRNGEKIGGEPAGTELGKEARYAVISFREATLSVQLDDAEAAFLSRGPTWAVDGTVSFPDAEGDVTAEGENHALDGDRLEIAGNTTLESQAKGLGGPSGTLGDVTTHLETSAEDSEIHGILESDAEKASLNGEPLEVSEEPPVPEEATIVARILGTLLLAWSLVKKLLGLLPGLVREAPLDHPRRRKIRDVLEERGLAHVREIQRATDIPIGSLEHHLEVLEEGDAVQSVRNGGYLVYFLPSVGRTRDEMERLAVLCDPTRRQMARIIYDEPAGQATLAGALDLSRSAVSQHLGKLIDAGLVERRGDRDCVYLPSALLSDWLNAANASVLGDGDSLPRDDRHPSGV